MQKAWLFACGTVLVLVAVPFSANCFAQSGNSSPAESAEGAAMAFALSATPGGGAVGSASAETASSEAADDQPADPAASLPAAPEPQRNSSGMRRFGVGARFSTLGIGGEAAYRLTRKINIRGGFNIFSDNRKVFNSGVNYDGKFDFRSAEAHLDWFFFRSLHLSPGVLVYNGDHLSATASVPAGGQFTLNDTVYQSSAADPASGSGTISFSKVAPSLLIGWGNLVPRTHKRLSISGEFGAIYQGAPKVAIGLTGSVCTPPASAGPTCQSTSTATIQSQITGERASLVHDLTPYTRFYPVVAVAVGYSF